MAQELMGDDRLRGLNLVANHRPVLQRVVAVVERCRRQNSASTNTRGDRPRRTTLPAAVGS